MSSQSVFMVRPLAFTANLQTAKDNVFQSTKVSDCLGQKALKEFDAMAASLRAAQIKLTVFTAHSKATPDAIFPNNWVSMHPGKSILYPMKWPNRRLERCLSWVKELCPKNSIIDLSPLERQHIFLEGTGSIVFDHCERVAYAGLSERTHPTALKKLAASISYRLETFATHFRGLPVYHTNVLMSIAKHHAVICTKAIEPGDRQRIVNLLNRSGRTVIDISENQLINFCGNILEVKNNNGILITIMSQTAYNAFSSGDLAIIKRTNRILSPAIPTIETYGGGGVRCMLAEVYH